MKRTEVNRLLGCLVLALVCQRPALSENQPATPPAASTCDSPYPDAQGNVTFSCRGLTDEQMRLLPSVSTLVEKLLHSGVDAARLDAQTDDILKMLQTSPKAASEPLTEAVPGLAAPEPSALKNPEPSKAEPPKPREVITYDYRGYKTSSLTGPMLGDERESQRYQELLALQKAAEWKKLLKEASREIKRVPDWLTPYAFKGVAQQHLGDTQDAIASLEYVDQHSTGNPDYDQVRHLLEHLRQAGPGKF